MPVPNNKRRKVITMFSTKQSYHRYLHKLNEKEIARVYKQTDISYLSAQINFN